MSPNTLVLDSVNYVESSKGVFVNFLETDGSMVIKSFFSFKPKILVPFSIPLDFLAFFFGSENITKNTYSYSVFFDDFSSLKLAARLLSLSFGLNVSVIEPERQFLISMRWTYNDAFVLHDDFFERVSFSKPNSLEKLFSCVCRVPLGSCNNFSVAKKIFIENLLFGSNLSLGNNLTFFSSVISKTCFSSEFSEIDYSAFLAFLASLGNFSLGDYNCDCCKANSIEADNLLKSSLVKVRFLSDGFSFKPVSLVWANRFFKNNNKHDFVVGPFFRDKHYSLLVDDAISLSKLGLVEIISPESFFWNCKNKTSFFSFEANRIVSLISFFSNSFDYSFSTSNVLECLYFESKVSEFSSISNGFLALMPKIVFGVSETCFVEAVHLECLSYAISSELALTFSKNVSKSFPLISKFFVSASGNLSFVSRQLSSSYNIQTGLLKFKFKPGS